VKILLKFLFIILFGMTVRAGGFNDLGNSARAVGMGGAFIGLADASYTVFYNPAGLAGMNRLNLSTTYSNLYPGIQDDNLYYFTLSGMIPAGIVGDFGFGGTFLNSNLWNENTFIFSYAREIYNSFSVGGSVKLLRWGAEAAPGEKALSYFGFTFDAGIHYTLKDIFDGSDLRMGIAAHNITEPSISESGSADAKLPMKLGLGLAYVSRNYNYLIAVDVVKEADDYTIKTGAEFLGLEHEVFNLYTAFYLRAGYDAILNESVYKRNTLYGGFGIQVQNLVIDYAYMFPLTFQHSGGSHKISLSYQFSF